MIRPVIDPMEVRCRVCNCVLVSEISRDRGLCARHDLRKRMFKRDF